MINVMADNGNDADARGPEVVPGLYWAVRESFVGYVSGNPDGQVFGDLGVETDGEGTFRFPLESARRIEGGWRIRFQGVVRFVAHGGMLDVTLASPVVVLDASGGSLAVASEDRDLRILEVSPADPVDVEGGWLVFPPLATALTSHGATVFGDVYAAGTPFAPLQIALPADAGGA